MGRKPGRPKRLNEAFVARVRHPGVYGDGRGGHGLQLRVRLTRLGTLTKRWRQQLRIGDRVTQVGLGSWPAQSLEEARTRALENIVAVRRGRDPRRADDNPTPPPPPPTPVTGPTFMEAAERVIALQDWRNPDTEKRWRRDLDALPFRDMPVSTVTSGNILEALTTKVWTSKPTVGAHRLRITGKVLRWAVAAGLRSDDPTPAVREALPRQKGKKIHHKAVSVAEIPATFRRLQQVGTFPACRLSLQFIVLTAARSGEVTGMTWSEVDWQAGCWRIPATRMKSGRPHRVPLSDQALAVLRQAGPGEPDGLVFPSTSGRQITAATFRLTLQRAGVAGTPHGFRSSFRDWCGEQGIDRILAELSLAHRIGNSTEQAYARADLLERRREVMERWGCYVSR